ncbi:MAG: hypothetical protein LAO51_18640 [Acidobacteriia bacterium]|nr:hypothetical protein [Terriglobia bacterium]
MTKAMRLFAVLGVAVLLLAATSPVSANCNPGKTMGQLSDQRPYQYTFMSGAVVDTPDVIGRFWQAGARTSANEGTATAALWLLPFGPDHIMYFFLGDETVTGCPAGDLITLIQSPATDGRGAYFAVARVTEGLVSSMSFDYTETSTNGFHMNRLPHPGVAVTGKAGSVLTMNVTMPDISTLTDSPSRTFWGNNGVLASTTITGMRLLSALGNNGAPPSPLASGWTNTTLRTTGAAGGPLTGFQFTCPASGSQDLYLAVQLELDGAAVLSDYVGEPTQVRCNSGLAIPPVKEKKPKNH